MARKSVLDALLAKENKAMFGTFESSASTPPQKRRRLVHVDSSPKGDKNTRGSTTFGNQEITKMMGPLYPHFPQLSSLLGLTKSKVPRTLVPLSLLSTPTMAMKAPGRQRTVLL